jgi:hypothetical protein
VVAILGKEIPRQSSPFCRGRSAGARGEVYGLAPLTVMYIEEGVANSTARGRGSGHFDYLTP